MKYKIKKNIRAQDPKSKIFSANLKRGQEEISKEISGFHFCLKKKSTKAQEEMVGFALILILVAIIFVVLLASYINKPSHSDNIGDTEANSFVQSFLQYTTACEEPNLVNVSVQKLIFKCQEKELCSYNMNPCKVLNDTIKGIVKESWKVGEKSTVKGYSLLILSERGQVLNITGGVVTNNYRGSEQDFGKGEEFITILFNAYI